MGLSNSPGACKLITPAKRRDPVRRLVKGMINSGYITEEQFSDLQQTIRREVKTLCEKADAAKYPAKEALTDLVYVDNDHDH